MILFALKANTLPLYHIFIAHSFTTYLTGRLAAHHLQLEHSQQSLLCFRQFQPNEEDRDIAVYPEYDLIKEHFPISNNILWARNHLRQFDQRVDLMTGRRPFTLYTHGTAERFIQALMSHPRCARTCIIEEGTGSYTSKKHQMSAYRHDLPLRQRFLLGLCYGQRIRPRGFIEHEGTYYCLNHKAFPGRDKTVLEYPEIRRNVLFPQSHPLPAGSYILAHDASVDFRLCPMETYAQAILQSLKLVKRELIHQKFHPSQSTENRSTICSLLRDAGFRIETIPDHSPLEYYLFCGGNHSFFGYVSSILLYARLNNLPAYSVFDFEKLP